jgi:hypothetical protein
MQSVGIAAGDSRKDREEIIGPKPIHLRESSQLFDHAWRASKCALTGSSLVDTGGADDMVSCGKREERGEL